MRLYGNLARTRGLLEATLDTDIHRGTVWNAYGVLEARHGTMAQAVKNFRRGIDMAPDHASFYRTFR